MLYLISLAFAAGQMDLKVELAFAGDPNKGLYKCVCVTSLFLFISSFYLIK